MGAVYEAYDREAHTRIALKTLLELDPQALYRLKREFRAAQDVEHPNLIRLGELCEEGGRWYFTMELVEGVDLLSHVWRLDGQNDDDDPTPATESQSPHESIGAGDAPPLDVHRLRRCAAQLASALFALHEAGRVHRDVKPSNVMVTRDGRVVLLDFGLAKSSAEGESSSTHLGGGTVAYMAPEQALGSEVDSAADWYSFGVVLYEALTGRLPYAGSSAVELVMKKQRYAPPPPSARVPSVPRDLDHLCEDLLCIDPTDRPTGSVVLERLAVDLGPHARGAAGASGLASQLTQTSPFVGRKAELDIMRAAFEHVLRGTPRAVSVHGESGIGKSALIREFVETAALERDNTLVLSGRCYERESVPYKAFDGVVDALARHMRHISAVEAARLLPANAALLRRVFPVLGRVEAIANAPRVAQGLQDPYALRARVFAALKRLLAALAESSPLIVVIDDLQWADPDSMVLLGEFLQPPDAPTLLLLMSSRLEPATGSPGEPTLAASVEHERILLQPLAPQEGAQLAECLLDRRGMTGNADPSSLAAEAKGHPLYIDELVRHSEVAGAAVGRRPRLDEAIWQRATELPKQARVLLELISVAGTPLPEKTIRAALDAEAREFDRHLSLLRVASLARTSGMRREKLIEPYHDRVREAVLENLAPAVRRERHAWLASALQATEIAEQRPQLLVRHLEGAGRVERAAEFAEESARRSERSLAFDRAAELYRTTLRLGDRQGDELRALRIGLANALANAGKCSEAAHVFAEAAIGADPATRLECQHRASQQFLISGHIEPGLDTLREVLRDVGVAVASTPQRALASLIWQRVKLRLRGLRWKERHESQIAPEELKRLDVFDTVATGLATVDTIRGTAFQSRRLLLALRTGERSRLALALLHEADLTAAQGGRGLRRASALIAKARRVSASIEDGYLEAWTVGTQGFLDYFNGRFRLAAQQFAASAKVYRDQTVGSSWELNQVRLFHLLALRFIGDFSQLRPLFERYVRDASQRGDRFMETSLLRAFAILALAGGEPDAARGQLERARWTPPGDTFHLQHWYELEARSEIAVYEGTAALALEQQALNYRRLEHSLLLRIQLVRAAARWIRARVLLSAATSEERERGARLTHAARLARRLARESVGFPHAWSRLVSAAVKTQHGETERACQDLREAVDLAIEFGMELVAASARHRLGELVEGSEGAESIADARDWMSRQGIADPARMLDLIAPGFAGV